MGSAMASRMLVALLMGVVGCTSLRLGPPDLAYPIWATEGASPLRHHAVSSRLGPPLERRWSFNAGAGFGRVSPLILGDVVLAPTLKGDVHAIDLNTGKSLGQESFGVSIEGTPVYAEGVLVVPVAWGGVAMVAHDLLDASRRWKSKGIPVSTGLVVWRDRIISGDVEGYVRSMRLDDGEEEWAVQLGDRSGIASTPVLIGDHVVVANDTGRLTALDARGGSPIWWADAGAPVLSSLAAAGGRVFVATTRGLVRAFDAESGVMVWEYDTHFPDVYLTAPAIGERDVVFGASDGMIRSLNPVSGLLQWEIDVSAAVTGTPILTGDMVYVGTMTGQLIALERDTGHRVWETNLGGRMKSAFALKGRHLIVMAEPRYVYVYESVAEGPSRAGAQ